MDERDWRISELETALKQIIDMPQHLINGVAYINRKEVRAIACNALDGGDGDD